MRKFFIILATLLLFGCSKPESKDVTAEEIMQEILTTANLQDMTKEYLTNPKTAEKYGINSNSVRQGIACISTDINSSDKIIVVQANSKDDIEDIERALAAEATGLSDAWADDNEETKKIDNCLLKTKGDFIILAVCDNSNTVEEIFDLSV